MSDLKSDAFDLLAILLHEQGRIRTCGGLTPHHVLSVTPSTVLGYLLAFLG